MNKNYVDYSKGISSNSSFISFVENFADSQVGLDIVDVSIENSYNERIRITHKREHKIRGGMYSDPWIIDAKQEWRDCAAEFIECLLIKNYGDWELEYLSENGFSLEKVEKE